MNNQTDLNSQKAKPLILIVDDIESNIKILEVILKRKDMDTISARSGEEALELMKTKLPDLILLDIMMPELSGFDVCEHIKKDSETNHIPIIFLTAKDNKEDIIHGFECGAVDYVTKPFNHHELYARISTHLKLQRTIQNLEIALKKVKTLSGMLPICCNCKKIRDDKGYWESVEKYLGEHSDAQFSHGICPDCMKELYPQFYDKKNKKSTD